MTSTTEPAASETDNVDLVRVEYQSRTWPLCLNPPPENLPGFTHCVKPQGHTGQFCQFEQAVGGVYHHTDVVFRTNPCWDPADDPADFDSDPDISDPAR